VWDAEGELGPVPAEGVLTTAVVPATTDPIWRSDHTFLLNPPDMNTLLSCRVAVLVRDEDVDETTGRLSYDPLGHTDIPLREVISKGKKVAGNAIVYGPFWRVLQKGPGMKRVDGRIKFTVTIAFEADSTDLLQSCGLSGPAALSELVDRVQSTVNGTAAIPATTGPEAAKRGAPRLSPSPNRDRRPSSASSAGMSSPSGLGAIRHTGVAFPKPSSINESPKDSSEPKPFSHPLASKISRDLDRFMEEGDVAGADPIEEEEADEEQEGPAAPEYDEAEEAAAMVPAGAAALAAVVAAVSEPQRDQKGEEGAGPLGGGDESLPPGPPNTAAVPAAAVPAAAVPAASPSSGRALLRISGIRAVELANTGNMLDKQDPAVKITVAGIAKETAR
jgi:hypothetical protein